MNKKEKAAAAEYEAKVKAMPHADLIDELTDQVVNETAPAWEYGIVYDELLRRLNNGDGS